MMGGSISIGMTNEKGAALMRPRLSTVVISAIGRGAIRR
jgi:hypothetical protein